MFVDQHQSINHYPRLCQFLRFAMNFHPMIDETILFSRMLNNGQRKINVLVRLTLLIDRDGHAPSSSFPFQLEIDFGL